MQKKNEFNGAERLRALVNRAGFTSDEKFAKACGYSGQSSVQRYLDRAEYAEKFLPLKFIQKASAALVGLGNPKIEISEVMALAGLEYDGDRPVGITMERRRHIMGKALVSSERASPPYGLQDVSSPYRAESVAVDLVEGISAEFIAGVHEALVAIGLDPASVRGQVVVARAIETRKQLLAAPTDSAPITRPGHPRHRS